MNKRAKEIFDNEIANLLSATTQDKFNDSLSKFAVLANILDQAGDENSANKIDDLLKQAGFWSSLLSGMSGGAGAAIWNAIKSGNFKDSLTEITKQALIGGATGVVVEYIIKWLDELPLIGSVLKELEGADKLRSILENVLGGAVANSDLANKIVDEAILAIEKVLGINQAAKTEKPSNVVPFKVKSVPQDKEPEHKDEGSDTATFQIAAGVK